MTSDPALDPLGTSADPRRYVPIPSSERALARLRANARKSPLLLRGPSGAGKTLLLRVLADRELHAGIDVVFSPFLHLAPDDIARWLLHLLGAPPGPGSADDQLLAELHSRARTTLLIIDEIQSTPAATARRLATLSRAAGPSLWIVTAGRWGQKLDAVVAALNPAALISLPETLPAREMRALCDALLASHRVDTELSALGRAERDAITKRALGVPALLKNELFRRVAERVLYPARSEASPHETASTTVLEGEPRPTGERGLEPPFEREPTARLPFAPTVAPPPTRDRLEHVRRALASSRSLVVRAGSVVSVGRSAVGTVLRRELERGANRGQAALDAMRHRFGAQCALAVSRLRSMLTRARAALEAMEREARRSAVAAAALVRARMQASAREASATARASVARQRRAAAAWAPETLARSRTSARETAQELARRLSRTAQRAHAFAAQSARAARARSPQQIGERALVAAAALASRGVAVSAAAVLLALFVGYRIGSHEAPVDVAAGPVTAPTIRVRVNARPWALIRVDGAEVGPTPLSHLELSAGPHEFEAEFPDGRSLRQRVEIGPERRSVSFR